MCYKCSKKLTFSPPIARSEVCPHCGSDVRCCKNCNHFSVGSQYDCKEHVQELISDKERANFCDWFSLNATGSITNKDTFYTQVETAKNQFNSLFGD